MKMHFTLRCMQKEVLGTAVVDSSELDRDLIQKMIDTERFLELVLKQEVHFEVRIIPPGTNLYDGGIGAVSLGQMDILLDKERDR